MGAMKTAEILHELHLIRLQLNVIQHDLDEIKRHQQHVNAHVNFVQNVYNRVKRPFFRMIHWADYMTRSSRPALTNQESNLQGAVQGINPVDVGDGNDK